MPEIRLAEIDNTQYMLVYPTVTSERGYLARYWPRFMSGALEKQYLCSDGKWHFREAAREHYQHAYSRAEAEQQLAWLRLEGIV